MRTRSAILGGSALALALVLSGCSGGGGGGDTDAPADNADSAAVLQAAQEVIDSYKEVRRSGRGALRRSAVRDRRPWSTRSGSRA